MTNGLSLGDIVFDPARLLYVKSLRAIVCVGLLEFTEKKGVSARAAVVDAIAQYEAESLIAIGPVHGKASVAALKQALPAAVRVHVVCSDADPDVMAYAEETDFEWHQELVWAKYRFAESLELGAIELYFVSAIGGAGDVGKPTVQHTLKVGKAGFGGMSLPIFLKGLGQVVLPSLNPQAKTMSILKRPELARYDALAAGHKRVFPMGRINEIAPAATFGKVPLSVSHLAGKQSKKPSKSADA
jgi:hypothetical protein